MPSGPIGQVGMIEGSQDVSEKTFEVTHDPLKVEGTGPLGEVVDVLDALDEVRARVTAEKQYIVIININAGGIIGRRRGGGGN